MHRESNSRPNRQPVRRRQVLKVALAIVLIWIAISSNSDAADGCCQSSIGVPDLIGQSLQLDGFTSLPDGHEFVIADSNRSAVYLQLNAEPASFDARADLDGWLATVVLRNQDGLPTVAAASATFEILDYLSDYRPSYSAGNPFPRSPPRLRWTMPLRFDQQGVATIALPIGRSFDWYSGRTSYLNSRVGIDRNRFGGDPKTRLVGSPYHGNFVTQSLYDRIDYPLVGGLQVQVTVPGEQPLVALTPIELPRPVLVDTYRRYR